MPARGRPARRRASNGRGAKHEAQHPGDRGSMMLLCAACDSGDGTQCTGGTGGTTHTTGGGGAVGGGGSGGAELACPGVASNSSIDCDACRAVECCHEAQACVAIPTARSGSHARMRAPRTTTSVFAAVGEGTLRRQPRPSTWRASSARAPTRAPWRPVRARLSTTRIRTTTRAPPAPAALAGASIAASRSPPASKIPSARKRSSATAPVLTPLA